MHRLTALLAGIFGTLAGFTVTARAADAVDPQDGSLDLAKTVYDAFAGGHRAYAAAVALVLAVALIRKYAGARWKALHTDAGSALLVLAGSFGATLAATLAGGGPATAQAAWMALCTAFAAAGGYAALKQLVIMPLAAKLPPWAAKVLTWLFVHASDPSNVAPATTPAPAPAPAAPASGNTPTTQPVQ